MTQKAQFVQWRILRSELEALLVEAELINRYQPPYNVLLKDDKSPLYVVITDEPFPRVLRVRRRDLQKRHLKGKTFGPFQSSYKVSEVLKLVRPIFPWCNAARRRVMRRCFDNHLGLCPGVCTGEISQADYGEIMRQLGLFLTGKTKQVTDVLRGQIEEYKASLQYEKAAVLRDKLTLIAEVTSETYRLRQDFFLPNLVQERAADGLAQLRQILSDHLALPREYRLHRIEGYDVSNTSGQQAVVSMVVALDGRMTPREYRSFNMRGLNSPNDFAMMAQALRRRAAHSQDWPTPQLLLIDGGKGQVRAVLEELRETPWRGLPVVGLAKDPDRIVIPAQVAWGEPGRLKIEWDIVTLTGDNLALQILQQVRDEAHRFGKSRHVKRRAKASLGIACET